MLTVPTPLHYPHACMEFLAGLWLLQIKSELENYRIFIMALMKVLPAFRYNFDKT